MTAEKYAEVPEIDEGSWVYLGDTATAAASTQLREKVAEACEGSGWAIVSRPVEERVGRGADPGHFFESMRHAVEHADVVVAFIGEGTEMSDVELALAYSHGRPVVGIRLSDQGALGAGAEKMLQEYGRARLITCADAEGCAVGLREAFADSDFAETIRQAR
jgi:hypothetical protein